MDRHIINGRINTAIKAVYEVDSVCNKDPLYMGLERYAVFKELQRLKSSRPHAWANLATEPDIHKLRSCKNMLVMLATPFHAIGVNISEFMTVETGAWGMEDKFKFIDVCVKAIYTTRYQAHDIIRAREGHGVIVDELQHFIQVETDKLLIKPSYYKNPIALEALYIG